MDGHADIPPSYSGLSQYPTTYNPFGNGGDESFNRATMPPPSGTSLAPTDQPYQYWSPGSSPSLSMLSQPPSSLFPFPPLSPSWSFGYSPSATVANKEMTPPPHPNTMLNSWTGMNSLLADQNNRRIYPKPIEMPVGVMRSQNENVRENSWSHENVNVGVNSNGNKRRAGNEIAPPNRIWRSVSADSSLNGRSSEPSPLPQGVSVDVGNDIAYGGAFTASQLSRIAACDDLKEMAVSDPKRLKRLLSNRESAARSKERRALRQSELEIKVATLYTQIDTLTEELKLEKRERMVADDECVQLKIRLDAREEHARICDALIKQLSGEVRRLREEVSREREDVSREREEVSRLREEVSEYRRKESERMNANMLEQLNINQQFQEKPQQTNYNIE